MTPRRLFIAGATGAVGRVLLPRAEARGVAVVPHVRPKSAGALAHPARVVLELTDPTLPDAMRGCTTLVQLIGTMRARFGSGDTYESSDVGTTRLLVEAAKQAGVDHVVLLSAALTGLGIGAYLKAKARAEALVRDSGLPFTIVRPSSFSDRAGTPSLVAALGAHLPEAIRGITLEQVAATLMHVAVERAPLAATLEGSTLWPVVRAATAA
ncbi:MAG: NAD(P)H-binding protein [Myxococcaceae bacterium]|jgi:nucleoside-diphosphate-sugar epimerase|nr:NAD(P)H-binding protein [Myxococcaceae bacterium]MCA3013913.1 NAD(P)H-binding protein [Myxococcaceae bacterium]